MSFLFDIIEGVSTNYTANYIEDTSQDWKIDKFKNWYCLINEQEYLITSNTENKLYFNNSFAENVNYKIIFIYRNYLAEIESEIENTTKITDNLLNNKYNIANVDFNNFIFLYLRENLKEDFDPMQYILNLYIVQRSFSYYILYLIYMDLRISADGFPNIKKDDYYNQYMDTKKSNLSSIILDYDKNNEEDWEEKKMSASTTFLIR